METKTHAKIQKLFRHNIFRVEFPPQSILTEDLFSEKTWQMLGLTKGPACYRRCCCGGSRRGYYRHCGGRPLAGAVCSNRRCGRCGFRSAGKPADGKNQGSWSETRGIQDHGRSQSESAVHVHPAGPGTALLLSGHQLGPRPQRAIRTHRPT